jgi:hypothetical protein
MEDGSERVGTMGESTEPVVEPKLRQRRRRMHVACGSAILWSIHACARPPPQLQPSALLLACASRAFAAAGPVVRTGACGAGGWEGSGASRPWPRASGGCPTLNRRLSQEEAAAKKKEEDEKKAAEETAKRQKAEDEEGEAGAIEKALLDLSDYISEKTIFYFEKLFDVPALAPYKKTFEIPLLIVTGNPIILLSLVAISGLLTLLILYRALFGGKVTPPS